VKILLNRAPPDEGGGGEPAATATTGTTEQYVEPGATSDAAKSQPQPVQPAAIQPEVPFETLLGQAAVSDELKEYGKKIGGLDKLLNHAYNQESLIGRKGVLVPGKTHEEDPDAWNEFYTELGRPGSPDAYEIPELPEGVEVDEPFAEWAKKTAHKWGLNQRQMAGFISDYVGYGQELQGTVKERGAAEEAKAKERLNMKYPGQADQVLSDIKAMYERYGGPEAVKAMEAAGLDLHEDFVTGAYQMSRRMRESGLFGSMQPGGKPVVSREQAQERINEIQETPSLRKVMVDRNDPGHANLRREFEEMQQVIHPPEASGGDAPQPDGSLVFKVQGR